MHSCKAGKASPKVVDLWNRSTCRDGACPVSRRRDAASRVSTKTLLALPAVCVKLGQSDMCQHAVREFVGHGIGV
jgi:hypothetical protein